MPASSRRTWNGYGLSWWRCACGAARRVQGFLYSEWDGRIVRIDSDPCKRCGSITDPVCIGDPWGG